MDLDSLPLLDRSLADPRHLLVLPATVEVEQVEALAAAHFDDAARTGPTALRLTGQAQVTGPWRLDEKLRTALDLPRWGVAALLLRSPVERSAPVPRELLGLGGLLDAFPDGEPIGLEGAVLRHLLAQARRLGGALRLAGTGTVLVPEPAAAVDLTVHSSVWLDPPACRQVLASALPGLGFTHEGPASDAAALDPLASDGSGLREAAVRELDEGERAWLHAEADALDAAVRSQPQVLDGYALHAEVATDPAAAAVPDTVEVGVSGDVPPEPALRGEAWARDGVVTYEIRWRPDDADIALGSRPPLAVRRRRERARLLIERATVQLYDAVGGSVLDDDGFLVALGSLDPGTTGT